MKWIFYLIVFSNCLYAQQIPDPNTFIGTWEYAANNQIFRFIVYPKDDHLEGDFELVEVNNGIETAIYKSNFYVPEYDSYEGHVFYGDMYTFNMLGGLITDNSINYQEGFVNRLGKDGSLSLTIIPPDISCRNQNCPVQARWKIDELRGMKLDSDPEHYNIPTDIVMTKVN